MELSAVHDIKGMRGLALQKERGSIRVFVLPHCMRHICVDDTSPLAKKGVRDRLSHPHSPVNFPLLSINLPLQGRVQLLLLSGSNLSSNVGYETSTAKFG